MAFSISNYAGAPAIGTKDVGITDPDTGTTKPRVPLGTIVRGVDPTYGEGEFIYLKGADGKPWLVAKEFCEYLRFKQVNKAVMSLPNRAVRFHFRSYR